MKTDNRRDRIGNANELLFFTPFPGSARFVLLAQNKESRCGGGGVEGKGLDPN